VLSEADIRAALPALRRYALKLTRRVIDAEDLIQDTLTLRQGEQGLIFRLGDLLGSTCHSFCTPSRPTCEHHAMSYNKHGQYTATLLNFVRSRCRPRDSRDLNVPGSTFNRAAMPS